MAVKLRSCAMQRLRLLWHTCRSGRRSRTMCARAFCSSCKANTFYSWTLPSCIWRGLKSCISGQRTPAFTDGGFIHPTVSRVRLASSRRCLRYFSPTFTFVGSVSLLTRVLEALFSIIYRLGLFEITQGHGFRSAKSWLVFRRSRTIYLAKLALVSQCFLCE